MGTNEVSDDKIMLFAVGDDGSVKADDLKSVFEAKGATVADVYVPEGKPFGFISFNSQEDAEKYGAMLIGRYGRNYTLTLLVGKNAGIQK